MGEPWTFGWTYYMAENLEKIVFIIGLSHRNENFKNVSFLLFDLKEKNIVSVLGHQIHNLKSILFFSEYSVVGKRGGDTDI